ncbi:MAG: peptidase M13, partial [Asticcacaulis sp.]
MTVFRSLLLGTACAVSAIAACAAPALALPQPNHTQRVTLMDELKGDAAEPSDADKMAALAKPYGTWGFYTAGMDTSVKPGDNFYEYADGAAVKALVIPGDQSGYGAFDKLADLSELRLKALIQELAAKPAGSLSADEAKIGAMYRSGMDNETRNRRDAAPLAPELRAIAAIKTKAQMAAYMGSTQSRFGSAVVGVSVDDDAKNPGFYTVHMGQGGLSLPDRDYYLKDSYADKLKAYEAYVGDMLRMAAWPDAAKSAHDIVAFETEIARVSWSRIESRDRTKTYNAMKPSELPAYAPGFDWSAYFKAAGVAGSKKIVVSQNTAMPKIAKIFSDTPLDTLKAWEAFATIDQATPYLSDRFYHRRFDFRSKTLYGVDEERPQWKRAVGWTDDNLGEALGRAYVARYFPPESKAKMTALVSDLLAAMKTHIENVTWMSDATKQKA